MGKHIKKEGPPVSGNTLAEADAQLRALRQQKAEIRKSEVGRLVRAGLSDSQVSTRLRMNAATVAKYREELKLTANRHGGALD